MPSTTPTAPPSILLVDDEPVLLRSMQRWLSKEAEVTVATNPKEAFRLAVERDFSLILCDINLGGIHGSDFLRAMREKNPRAAQRVVFMTGAVRETVPGALVILKPVDKALIRQLLRAST